MTFTAPLEDEVPILIVGGGGAGLTASMLLARQGVEHLLVSARPTTSDLPKAHFLNQRVMEMLDAVYGHRLARLESWGAGGADELWRAASTRTTTGSKPVLRGMRAQSMEFSELNVEYGYSYESAAVASDGTPAPELVDDIRVYQPSTRPGSPLPHAWIDDEDGNRRPIKDLVAAGRFLLMAGEDGEAWCEAAKALATEANLALDAVRIGHLDGDVYDPRCAWLRQRNIQSDGAMLVRPDRFVAWRGPTAADDPLGDLADAFSQILARPVAARPVPAGSEVSS